MWTDLVCAGSSGSPPTGWVITAENFEQQSHPITTPGSREGESDHLTCSNFEAWGSPMASRALGAITVGSICVRLSALWLTLSCGEQVNQLTFCLEFDGNFPRANTFGWGAVVTSNQLAYLPPPTSKVKKVNQMGKRQGETLALRGTLAVRKANHRICALSHCDHLVWQIQ